MRSRSSFRCLFVLRTFLNRQVAFQQDMRSFDCTEYYISYDQGQVERWENKCSFVDMLCSAFQALCGNLEERETLIELQKFVAEVAQLDFLGAIFQIGTPSEWEKSELRAKLLQIKSSVNTQACGFFIEAVDETKTAVSVTTARILQACAKQGKSLRELIDGKMSHLRAVGEADITQISESPENEVDRYIEWYEAANTSMLPNKMVTISSRLEDTSDSCEIDARLALLLRSQAPSPSHWSQPQVGQPRTWQRQVGRGNGRTS